MYFRRGRVNTLLKFASLLWISSMACVSSLGADTDVLVTLQQELRVIRASKSDQPIQIRPVPNVDSLAGRKVSDVLATLGDPDTVGEEIVYLFFRLPAGWRGGGPELVLRKSSDGKIEGAHWRSSR